MPTFIELEQALDGARVLVNTNHLIAVMEVTGGCVVSVREFELPVKVNNPFAELQSALTEVPHEK